MKHGAGPHGVSGCYARCVGLWCTACRLPEQSRSRPQFGDLSIAVFHELADAGQIDLLRDVLGTVRIPRGDFE